MDTSTLVADNVTELLAKIIDFTERRRKILSDNISECQVVGFVPQDLDIEDFAELMTRAISEHIRSQRLLLCDSENTKFGPEGAFESFPVIDYAAAELLRTDKKAFLSDQIDKLAENALNNKIALKLLGQRQRKCPIY